VNSNLNVVLQETPFSVYLTIRKKVIHGRGSNPRVQKEQSEQNRNEMEQVIGKLEAQIEAFANEKENYCSELQNLFLTVEKTSRELSEVKAEHMTVLKNNKTLEKNLENKVSENQITLKSLKYLTGENQNLRSDFQSAAKNIKLKEKEIYRLEGCRQCN
jgi:chromosome segregation ATPase